MADSPYMVGNALDQFQQGQLLKQKMETQDLANQTTQAQLPGVIGQSQTLAAQGQVAQQTLPETLQKVKSDLMTKMSDNDAKQMTNFGGQIAQFGSMLDQVPPPARMAVINQFASRFNVPSDSPLLQGLAKAPPDKLPELVKTMGSNMVQLSADYIKGAGLLGVKGQNAMGVAGINADAKRDVAEIGAKSRVDVAGLNNASAEKRAEAANQLKVYLLNNKARSPQQLVAQLMAQYQDSKDPEDLQRLSQAIDVAQAVSQNPQLAKLYQDQAVTGAVLPGMPQTVPPPPANPTATFPTKNNQGLAGLPPGATRIGSSEGRDVYELPDGSRIRVRK